MTETVDFTANPSLVQPVIEFILADAAWEHAYDELLGRRGYYIQLYEGVGYAFNNSIFDDEMLDAIDNNDTEFWQFHNNVCQRLENAQYALTTLLKWDTATLRNTFASRYGNQVLDLVIDWERHRLDGLYDPHWMDEAQP